MTEAIPTKPEVLGAVTRYNREPNIENYRLAVTMAIEADLIESSDTQFRTQRQTIELITTTLRGVAPPEALAQEMAGTLTYDSLLGQCYEVALEAAKKDRRVKRLPTGTLDDVISWAQDAAASAFEEGICWVPRETNPGMDPYMSEFESRCKGRGMNHYDVRALFTLTYNAYLEKLTRKAVATNGTITPGESRSSGHTFQGERWSR